jgi:hypothetical protein
MEMPRLLAEAWPLISMVERGGIEASVQGFSIDQYDTGHYRGDSRGLMHGGRVNKKRVTDRNL